MGIGWAKKMRDAFGASFLWLVSLIYFTQEKKLQLLAAERNFDASHGLGLRILSDCFPIRRRKRVPYLIVATVLSLIPWLILGLVASLRGSSKFLTTFLTVQNIGSAMADVVIDAMIAEAVRFEHAGLAGDLQSLSWSAMAFGGICGSLLGDMH
uniref:Uncharacterized protein n=1 Tax=Ananas comosus var. bracteatus TaxID=296719 RepID=A0A6V7QH56_ANACO|nr:unnamed protein product [Ananas comosus var. bracteatus]